jgi:multidrug efflux system membrane fusion protein
MHGNLERTRNRINDAMKTAARRIEPARKRAKALYEKSPIKGSRLAAVALVLFAVLWIGSGILFPHHEAPAPTAAAQAAQKFRVAIAETQTTQYQPKLVLSGRTEADKKVAIVSRTSGVLTDLRVRRGQVVRAGDVIALLTDEGRAAQLAQARALVIQRRAEFEARTKLIEQGNLPKLEVNNIATQLRSAEAALAQAEAEIERIRITAPWVGVVNPVTAEEGQHLMLMPGANGNEIAQMISLNPIVAIVEVSERKLGGVRMGEKAELRLVTGEIVVGKVRYISKSAAATTRTYRIDIEAPNPDNRIPDGITTEVAITLAAVTATKVPRSALTFSAQGKLGVRAVDAQGKVSFIPVELVDDEQQFMWVAGIETGTRVIVQGQDFVREGQIVETVTGDLQSAKR